MKEITKDLAVNILVLVITYIIPLLVFNRYQDDYINIGQIQKSVFITLLLGSLLLFYINHKNRVRQQNSKWVWRLFEIIGILGFVYSLIILGLIFIFRHGVSF